MSQTKAIHVELEFDSRGVTFEECWNYDISKP